MIPRIRLSVDHRGKQLVRNDTRFAIVVPDIRRA